MLLLLLLLVSSAAGWSTNALLLSPLLLQGFQAHAHSHPGLCMKALETFGTV
jgi:hypothetical protein